MVKRFTEPTNGTIDGLAAYRQNSNWLGYGFSIIVTMPALST